MKTLSFTLSDGAYAFLEKIAEAKEKTVDEYVLSRFQTYERHKDNQKMQEEQIKNAERSTIDRKAREVYNKHTLQSYILEYFPNSKEIKKTIDWRTCPIQPDTRREKEHIGEYWYSINKYKKDSDISFIRTIDASQMHYFKTLKSLKKAINRVFGHDHYKIKTKE
jgi:hypothetical protein